VPVEVHEEAISALATELHATKMRQMQLVALIRRPCASMGFGAIGVE